MDFFLTPERRALRESIEKRCARFDDEYWLDHDASAIFPHEFHRALAESGCLGIAMPEAFGGTELGVTDAAIVMHTVARSAGGMSAASAIHINIFGPHSIVVFGTEEQKQRWLPDLITGEAKCCFGVTEPDAGLDTTNIKTRAERTASGYVVRGTKIWTSTARSRRGGIMPGDAPCVLLATGASILAVSRFTLGRLLASTGETPAPCGARAGGVDPAPPSV